MAGMEAAALSAAVTGMLKIVAKKLAPLVIKEYSSIVGVKKNLEELKGLAEGINGWLEERQKTHGAMGGATSLDWLKRLKDIAHTIDDVVDEFQLETEKLDADGYGGIVSKHLGKKPKSFLLQCKVAHKINAVKKRFSVIVKQRTDLNAIVDQNSVCHLNKTTADMPTLPIVNEAAIVGRGQDKNKIITKLVKSHDQQELEVVSHAKKEVVSIIGLGGTGKTTLAKLVFNDCEVIEKHFEVRLWVHVSQEFDIKKLVEKLFEAVTKDKSDQHSLQHMSETITEKLSGKNFLLVLDDVWIEDRGQHGKFEEGFMAHLKKGTSRSKILVTTRSTRVAEVMGSTERHDLPLLSPDDSWQLFDQSFGPGLKELGHEYQQVGKEVVRKCGGIPLAIKVIAGTLRDKKLIGEWEAMRDNNLLDGEGEGSVSACLKLSYFYLPSHLKQCFAICSLYPKGHAIYKEQLIDIWIAHNMISLTSGVDYLEDMGEKYFNSLVQVSFLHDVDVYYGRLACKMHDLVHDLARSILCEEISTSVPEDATSSTKGYRYFSLIKQPEKCLPRKVFHKTHAIYVDKGCDIKFGKALEDAKHLRSIIVNHISSTPVLTAIFQIKNLKYVEMDQLNCEALPEAISDIWSLQAMHVTSSGLLELPKSIGKLQKLRTLNLSYCRKLKCLPDSIGDCNMLSSIDLCHCQDITALPNSIGRNHKLRVLRLGYTRIEKLPSSVTTLRNLECLDLHCCTRLVELPEGIGELVKLRVLNLGRCRRLEELPEGVCNLEKLQDLNLEYCSELLELPKSIGKLGKLRVLNLEGCGKLGGMPVGIGELSGVQNLALFVVGEGENFARISELANVGRNSQYLIIRGIEHVMDPDDAHSACLKLKTNLQRLSLEWKRYDDDEVNTELEQGVLDGVEPPPGIKELKVIGYPGREYARWMQNQIGGVVKGCSNLPFLRVMNLSHFPNLKHLQGLVELPCLEELQLHHMPSLESISGGPFPSLAKLIMSYLDNLGEMWMVAERAISDGEDGGGCINCSHHLGQFQVGNCVAYLEINRCPKLKIKRYLPLSVQRCKVSRSTCPLLQLSGRCRWEGLGSLTSLQVLNVSRYDIHELPDCLGALRSLQKLTISDCKSLSSLPQSMGHMTSLHSLSMAGCATLDQLPECIGDLCSLRELQLSELPRLSCLPESICGLTSLEELSVDGCSGLKSLPEGINGLTALKALGIARCPEIKSLPEGINGLTALWSLFIVKCSGIKSLPEGIKHLTALRSLVIFFCPHLTRRCKREEGEDWHLIAHVPKFNILPV